MSSHILFFNTGKEFQGQRIKVSMARRRTMMGGMRGGIPMRDGMMGRGGKRLHCLPLSEVPNILQSTFLSTRALRYIEHHEE